MRLTAMGATVNLTHHFLIAMPNMADPNFAHTLTFVCEHNPDGALGLVVNRPIEMTLSALFEQIEVPLADGDLRDDAGACSAVPCRSTAASCCIARSATGNPRLRSATSSGSRRRRTSSRRSAAAKVPTNMLVSLGYAGWEAGQLEQELAANAWLTVEAEAERAVRRSRRSSDCRLRCGCSASTCRNCPRASGTHERPGAGTPAIHRRHRPCIPSLS